MSKPDDLYCVDLTSPARVPYRKQNKDKDSIVDLTSNEDDVEVVVPAAKRQKHNLPLHFSDSEESEHEVEPITTTTTSEKRLLPYRRHASKELQERIQRATTRRIYLIQQKPSPTNVLEREFVVIGHNGNVYTVKISQKPSCDCEDNKNGQSQCHCEHIMFVFLKVFKLSSNDPVIYQKALLTTEVQAIFNSYTTCQPSALADPSVTEKYLEIMRSERSRKQRKVVPRKPIEGDCPICFEKLKEEDGLVWCKYSCGNNVHETCFKQWRDTKSDVGQEVKCTYCRARWDQGAEELRKALTKDGYLNLAEFQTPMLRDIPGPYLYLLPQLLQLTSRLPWPVMADDEEDDEDFDDDILDNSSDDDDDEDDFEDY